jgi:hypothetical protein
MFSLSAALQLDVGSLERSTFGRFLHHGPQLFQIDRLEQVIERPLTHGVDRRLDGAVAGDQDHLGVGQVVFGLGQQRQTIDVVHLEVGDDDLEVIVGNALRSLGSRGGHRAVVPGRFEPLGQQLGVGCLVIDDQHMNRLGSRRGGKFFLRGCHAQDDTSAGQGR